MYILYLDESGRLSNQPSGNHFALVGLALPAADWKSCVLQIEQIRTRYRIRQEAEIHTAWIVGRFEEQSKIVDFESLADDEKVRKIEVERQRVLANISDKRKRRRKKQNFDKSKDFVHLTQKERIEFLRAIADVVGGWRNARIFGDVRKNGADPNLSPDDIFSIAFEQVVTRFNRYLRVAVSPPNNLGIIVQDNHEQFAAKITEATRRFHEDGTRWVSSIPHIVDTPMFVDSKLTFMIQIADLSLRVRGA